jgi:hypothetical protein
MSVSLFFVQAIIHLVEQSGVSRSDLFARSALDLRRIDHPGARLDIEEFDRLLEAAVELTENTTGLFARLDSVAE